MRREGAKLHHEYRSAAQRTGLAHVPLSLITFCKRCAVPRRPSDSVLMWAHFNRLGYGQPLENARRVTQRRAKPLRPIRCLGLG